MSEFLRATLEELSKLAWNPDTRVAEQSHDDPINWRPTEVIDPTTGSPFTEAGAWEYIAAMLTSGLPVNTIPLLKPPNKVGYTMNIPSPSGIIYIKVRLGIGKIIGRSFHYSVHQ